MIIINKKQAKIEDFTTTDKYLTEKNKDQGMSDFGKKVTTKNMNSSLENEKSNGNTPFDKQLEAARKNNENGSLVEKNMSDKIVNFGDQCDKISAINMLAQSLYQSKADKILEVEKKQKKDNSYWEEGVGDQILGEKTTVDKNVPDEYNGLFNTDKAFEKGMNKVEGQLKDADALLFHIYATAYSENRELDKNEKQQIMDINSSKARILAALNNESVKVEPYIAPGADGSFSVYDSDGTFIDKYNDLGEARADFPEAIVKE